MHPQVATTKAGPVCLQCLMKLDRDIRYRKPGHTLFRCPDCQREFIYCISSETWYVR